MYDERRLLAITGGETWEDVADVHGGMNDHDDMCAPSPDTVWTVQNQNAAGTIYHVRVFDVGEPKVSHFNPFNGYLYEGMTCVDDQTALVVGFTFDPSQPARGIILSTTDGGQNWTRHSAPLDNVWAWKTSFVGARR